ncbi:MAG TPA: hypothetical protein VGZ52_06835, partial [Acidimicrobiales bacterium]|nr:hypothetical protein [Acidimicrobiales bacterium]
MSVLDVATIAALAFVGVRVATGTRVALSGKGRQRVTSIARGLRPRHFLLAFPAIACVMIAVIAFISVPYLDWGWWTALGGFGNPVTGGTERTAGTPLEWIVPAVFIVLLVP